MQTHRLRDADRLLAVIDRQRSGTESPNNGSPVFSPNPARNVELELHLVYLAVWVLMGDDPSPFKVIFRYGDLDRGRYIVAKKGDLDAGILFSLLLQIKLHEAMVHTVWGTGCSLEIDPHFLGERLNLDTTSFHQSNPRTGEQERVKAVQTVSCKEGLVAGTGKGHQWASVLQGTDIEMYSPHVITDQVIVT